MKKIVNIFSILILILISACSTDEDFSFEIKGKITGAENKKIILETMNFPAGAGAKFTILDTARADEDGNFIIQNNLAERMTCRITIEGDRQNYYIVSLYDEKMELNADLSKLENPKVSGSDASNSILTFLGSLRDFDTDAMKLNDTIIKLKSTGQDAIASEIIAKIETDYYNHFKNYVDTTSEVSNAILALEQLFSIDYEYVKAYAKKASASADSNSIYVKELNEKITMQEALAAKSFIGKPAIDIIQPNEKGQQLKLSDLKGKVVLIDFWASWCGPCRDENPNLVKVYNNYVNKGFTIFSVSLDTDKNKWLEAVKKDGLIWNHHVALLNRSENKAATDYRVTGIPMSFLVDKEGIIVAENLRGDLLEKAVKEIIKQ